VQESLSRGYETLMLLEPLLERVTVTPCWTAVLVVMVSVPIHPVAPPITVEGLTLVILNDDPATVVVVVVVDPDVEAWTVK